MSEEIAANALELWQSFDLTGRKVTLEKTLIELREAKGAAVERRKQLNENTKRFRSLDKTEQVGTVTELLKGYQNEIDLLTKRAKNSEAAFVSLYKALSEVPDPVSALMGLLSQGQSSSESALEIARLQADLRQYEEEFRLLKNQDIRIRQLEEQLRRYQDNIEGRVTEAVESSAADIERRAEERIREHQELQALAERRALEAADTARAAQQAAERCQTQLLQLSTSADRKQADLQAEIQLLLESNRRLSSHAAELESAAASSLRSAGGGQRTAQEGIEEMAVFVRDEERQLRDAVSELQVQLHAREEALRAERLKFDGGLEQLSRQVDEAREELRAAQEELQQRPTREELHAARRQLRAMQRLAFRVEDADDADASSAVLLSPSPSLSLSPLSLSSCMTH